MSLGSSEPKSARDRPVDVRRARPDRPDAQPFGRALETIAPSAQAEDPNRQHVECTSLGLSGHQDDLAASVSGSDQLEGTRGPLEREDPRYDHLVPPAVREIGQDQPGTIADV